MGEEHAAALMEWLPAGPLASKADIDHLAERTDLRFDAMRQEMRAGFAEVRAEFRDDLRTHTLVLVGAMVTIAGLTASAARIF